jgi:hypothetical protein
MANAKRLIDIFTPMHGETDEERRPQNTLMLQRAVSAAIGLRKADESARAWAVGFSDALIPPGIVNIEPIFDVYDWLNFEHVEMHPLGGETCKERTNVVIVRLTDDSPRITDTDIAFFWHCVPQTKDRIDLVSFVVARGVDDWVEMPALPVYKFGKLVATA